MRQGLVIIRGLVIAAWLASLLSPLNIASAQDQDATGARDAVLHGAPSRRHVVPERRDGTETGDDDPTPHYAPTLVFR